MNEAHEYYIQLAGLQELIEIRRQNHVSAVFGGGYVN
jgi:hypothetical protein